MSLSVLPGRGISINVASQLVDRIHLPPIVQEPQYPSEKPEQLTHNFESGKILRADRSTWTAGCCRSLRESECMLSQLSAVPLKGWKLCSCRDKPQSQCGRKGCLLHPLCLPATINSLPSERCQMAEFILSAYTSFALRFRDHIYT